MNVNNWMSWEGGIDLVGLSQPNLEMPNVIVHVARMVHTPVGSAPSGMVLIPNADGSPQLMGFVSSNENVGNYFAPNIFAGTPFEQAPTLLADFDFQINSSDSVEVSITIGENKIHLKLSGLGDLTRVDRQSPNLPFHDASIEAAASNVELSFNGDNMSVIVPPIGMSGGPAAVYSATGFYAR